MNEQELAAYIKTKVQEDNRWLERAIVAIYQRQTSDEQESQITKYENGVGFTAFDANSGAYYAKWILSGRSLSGRHLEKAKKMMGKYSKQLARIAEEKFQECEEN